MSETRIDIAASPATVRVVSAAEVPTIVQPIFQDYGEWVADRLAQDLGITFSADELARHHDAFRGELPGLLGPRGRLLVAFIKEVPVGVGALKPVDDRTAEIKRMYVRPKAQGAGAGRALLERLVREARAERYTNVRLETLRFMTRAHALYRTFGFVDAPKFEGANGMLVDRVRIVGRLL